MIRIEIIMNDNSSEPECKIEMGDESSDRIVDAIVAINSIGEIMQNSLKEYMLSEIKEFPENIDISDEKAEEEVVKFIKDQINDREAIILKSESSSWGDLL